MPKGIFITYFDAIQGVVLRPEYAYVKGKTQITNGLAQQLYFAHSTGETKNFLEIKMGDLKISSYYTGMVPKSRNQICLALVLEEKEVGAAYKEFLKIKASEIIKILDDGGEIRIEEIYRELEKREKPVDKKHLMIRILADEETWKALAALRDGRNVSPTYLSPLKMLELVTKKQNGNAKPKISKIKIFKSPSNSIIDALENGKIPKSIRRKVGEALLYAVDELRRQIQQDMEEKPTDILEPLVNSTNYQITNIIDEEGIISIKELSKRLGIEEETILYHMRQLKEHLLADYTKEYLYPLLKVEIEINRKQSSVANKIKKIVKYINDKDIQ
ncbi:MAG: winged helix-turn-helix transcriptional regulator [Candidatus Freyarchaeum deiterrae]